jgi:predicted DNA-binding transcriptional regulator AlpA
MQIVRRPAARRKVGVSKTTEHRLMHTDPTWPRVVRITAQLTGYFEDELDAWIAARPRARVGLESEPDQGRAKRPKEAGAGP